jgi:acyl-CoA thioesterase-1
MVIGCSFQLGQVNTTVQRVTLKAYEAKAQKINAPCVHRPLRGLLVACVALLLVLTGRAQAEATDPAPLVILALGDSLSAGYNLPADAAFPVQLERALRAKGHRVRVINGGVSGDTSAGGLARLDWMLAQTPDLTLVELGANDALRGLSPVQTEANLDAILSRLHQRDSDVLLIGMLAPPNMGRDYGVAFKDLYPRLAQKHEVALYPFFLEGVAARPDVLQSDGMHPTAAGVAEIVRRILPQVEALLPAVPSAAGDPQ